MYFEGPLSSDIGVKSICRWPIISHTMERYLGSRCRRAKFSLSLLPFHRLSASAAAGIALREHGAFGPSPSYPVLLTRQSHDRCGPRSSTCVGQCWLWRKWKFESVKWNTSPKAIWEWHSGPLCGPQGKFAMKKVINSILKKAGEEKIPRYIF